MKGSATEDSTQPAQANPTPVTARRVTPGLVAAALLHAGLLAWALSQSGALPAARELPLGWMLAGVSAAALLTSFLIAALARQSALSFVVVPSMLVAGSSAHAVSEALLSASSDPRVVAGVLGFGSLGVAVNLSFGAAAIACRVAPNWREVSPAEPTAVRLGAFALVVVVAVNAGSAQLAPLAALCAAVGLLVLGGLHGAVHREGPQGSAMAELVSALTLSIGALWTSSIVAGASSIVLAPGNWALAQSAMTHAWLNAMPLVLAAVVSLWPVRVATGAGVKRGRSTTLAIAIGVVTSVGLGQVSLLQAEPLLEQATTRPSAVRASRPKPAETAQRQPGPRDAQAPITKTPSAGDAVAQPVVTPDPLPENVVEIEHEQETTRLVVHVKIDGPMLPKDARQGVSKSLERLMSCYEKSNRRGDPLEVRLGLLIDTAGSVKQAEPVARWETDKGFVTCAQLAFYRSGFSGPTRHTWLELGIAFSPKG